MSLALAVGLAAGAAATGAGHAAAEDESIVVNGVVRDNVEQTHSPQMAAMQAEPDESPSGPQVQAAAADAHGIDVASHQHPNGAAINWSRVSAGNRVVGIKASEGNYYANPYYAGDRSGATGAGMYTYAYHFAIPNVGTAVTQANYFVDRAGYRQDGSTLPPALDIEWNPYAESDGSNACYGLSRPAMVTWINAFVTQVKRRTGVDPIIYTAASWWADCTGASTAFADYPLWVASYRSTPSLPAGWDQHTIWQYTSTLTVPGISALTDGNRIRGGEPTLNQLAVRSSEPAGFTPTDPVRVLDTRNKIGVATRTPLGANAAVTLDLSGRLPATATAAVLNVTGLATGATYLTVWPNGSIRPTASNVNLAAKEIRPNLVTVQLGADRKVRLHNSTGSTHVLADLAGWYATDATGLYTAHAPQRVLNTRSGNGKPMGPSAVRVLDLSSRVPENATAVTLNLTGVAASRGTYVTAWPTGSARPRVSNLNLVNANATPNLVTVKLGTDRSVSLYNNAGSVHLIADLAGYYTPDGGARYVATTPRRLLDTRRKAATWVPVAEGRALALSTLGTDGVTGTVLNLTGVAPAASTFVSVSPWTTTPVRPSSSSLNLMPRQTSANLVATAVSPDSKVWIYNNTGTIHLVADLSGYFTES